MKVVNWPTWDYVANSTDWRAREICVFAEEWADAMQTAMANGETLEECAGRTRADALAGKGMTGLAYSRAVGLLTECWEHGGQLRAWYDLDTSRDQPGFGAFPGSQG